MGVKTDGVHYESTVTWVRTLAVPTPAAELAAAMDEAHELWVRAARGRDADDAPVTVEPVAGKLLVKVPLRVERHDVQPALHTTRSAAEVTA